ncbi:hypothetical protein KC349_g3 [Hortaea werneckii]|nr:hypothetical protein KC349_g3 [Hortaea werneckii]
MYHPSSPGVSSCSCPLDPVLYDIILRSKESMLDHSQVSTACFHATAIDVNIRRLHYSVGMAVAIEFFFLRNPKGIKRSQLSCIDYEETYQYGLMPNPPVQMMRYDMVSPFGLCRHQHLFLTSV